MNNLISEFQALLPVYNDWMNDSPKNFALVDIDDFFTGLLVGKGYSLAEVMEFLPSPEAEDIFAEWEKIYEGR